MDEDARPADYIKGEQYIHDTIMSALEQHAKRVPTFIPNADIVIRIRDGTWAPEITLSTRLLPAR